MPLRCFSKREGCTLKLLATTAEVYDSLHQTGLRWQMVQQGRQTGENGEQTSLTPETQSLYQHGTNDPQNGAISGTSASEPAILEIARWDRSSSDGGISNSASLIPKKQLWNWAKLSKTTSWLWKFSHHKQTEAFIHEKLLESAWEQWGSWGVLLGAAPVPPQLSQYTSSVCQGRGGHDN